MTGILSLRDFAKRLRAGETEEVILGPSSDRTAKLVAPMGEIKFADETARTVDWVISTARVDRSDDSVAVDGWDLSDYQRSGPVLWSHDSYTPAIARGINTRIENGALKSTAVFAPAEVHPLAETIFQLVKLGFINTASVGFLPKEYSWSNDKGREYGIDFKSQVLLEWSICNIPCNPDCLVVGRSKGVNTEPLRQWAEQLLDGGGKVLVPRSLLEETFRQAKTPRAVRQKFLAKPVASEWKVGAADDLPVVDREEWDAAAAAKRMLDAAGFDGDSPDFAKAARGFLVHDAANPALRSSYKLPFADIVDGELKAVKSGIAMARGRIDQAGLPVGALDDAHDIADEYDRKNVGKIEDSSVQKAGRKISKANEALLQKAMDHHASASECIKQVLDSNEPDEPDEDDQQQQEQLENLSPPQKTETTEQPEDARAKRLAHAAALRKSLKG